MRRWLLALIGCVSVSLTAYGADLSYAKTDAALVAFGKGGQIKMLYDDNKPNDPKRFYNPRYDRAVSKE